MAIIPQKWREQYKDPILTNQEFEQLYRLVNGELEPINFGVTAVPGGIIYTDASDFQVSAAGTTGQALISGGTGAPTWFAGTQGGVLWASGASGILASSALGSANTLLKSNGTSAPSWTTVTESSGALAAITTIVASSTITLGTGLIAGSATMALLNTVATTINFGAAASTGINMGHASGTNIILGNTKISLLSTNQMNDFANSVNIIIYSGGVTQVGDGSTNVGVHVKNRLYVGTTYSDPGAGNATITGTINGQTISTTSNFSGTGANAVTIQGGLIVGGDGGTSDRGITFTQNWLARRDNDVTGDFRLYHDSDIRFSLTSAGNATIAGSLTLTAGALSLTDTSGSPITSTSNNANATWTYQETAAFSSSNTQWRQWNFLNSSSAIAAYGYEKVISSTTTAGAHTGTWDIQLASAGTIASSLLVVGRNATIAGTLTVSGTGTSQMAGLTIFGATTTDYGRGLGQRADFHAVGNYGGIALYTWSSAGIGPLIDLNASRGVLGTYTPVQSGDALGIIAFRGVSVASSTFVDGCYFAAFARATWSSTVRTNEMGLYMAPTGGTTPVESWRIDGSVTSGDTRMYLWNSTTGTLKRVLVKDAGALGVNIVAGDLMLYQR